MKKTDIAMIILIASISVLLAYFLVKATPLGAEQSQTAKVQTAEAISTNVDEPDKTVFNKKAINPTVEITIGNK